MRSIALFLTCLMTTVAIQANECVPTCFDACPRIYVGGSYLYAVTNLPQNTLQDPFEGAARQPNIFGEVATTRTKRNPHHYDVYVGYQQPIDCHWLVGAEAGYKDLGMKKECGIFDFLISEDNEKRPFRSVHSYAWDFLVTLNYETCYRLNIFLKGGAAFVKMKLQEGDFFSAFAPEASFEGPYAPYCYEYYNLYPELVAGFGYKVSPCLNLVVSYGHIFGPGNTARYVQEFLEGNTEIVRRPSQCASYDYLKVGLEISLSQLPFFKGC